MESTVEILQEEGQGRVRNQSCRIKAREDLVLRKVQLAIACSLFCVCALALLTAYVLIGNLRSAREADFTIQVQNKSLSDSILPQAAGWTARGNEKPRAHLTGTNKQDSLDVTGAPQAVQWEDHRGLAFIKNGMKYENRSLKIPKSGDYYIYAQVTFRESAVACTEAYVEKKNKKLDYITQVIIRFTASYPEPELLVSGSKTLCEMKNDWYTSIYLGGVFNMEQGDRLMVNVSDITRVDVTQEQKTYFGAFLL
ncbi:tumor necrosis factor ligand superfamily member 15 [Rhinatrema bivittatum]|uniref:tumor necrosis factor ligand superfamily member 15 n=1 Tax=Rhinatrema bivittatum TaxID=194408 RepID=UPI00112C6E70|nr:tumor necrosis factor ligand superfamily member 15 [Rhinatrema bivittatum]